MSPRIRNAVERLLLVTIIATIAVFSVSSFWIAGLVATVTVLLVLLDMIATSRRDEAGPAPASEPTPRAFRVDLKRRE